jgi:Sortase domain
VTTQFRAPAHSDEPSISDENSVPAPSHNHVTPAAVLVGTPASRRERKRQRYQRLSYGESLSEEARELALGSTRGVPPTAPDLSDVPLDRAPVTTRKERKTRCATYRPRRWPMRIMVVTAGATAVVLMTWSYVSQQRAGFTELPEPPVAAAPMADRGSTAGKHHRPAAPTAVAQSRPTQIYIPSSDSGRVISTDVLPLTKCRNGIDPPTQGPSFGAVWGCTDFEQPGTSTKGPTVVAGHSSPDRRTAFNRLYVQGQSAVNKLVYLKTATSGDRWLTYRIDKVRVPQKAELPYMREVWGAPGENTTGRLLLITCRQEPGVTPALKNYVAVASFVGVR